MRPCLLAILLSLCLLPALAAAKPEAAETAAASAATCRDAALAAERRHNIPSGLLSAIAMVESGRQLGRGAARSSWPWTIHAEGRGRYHDSKADAVASVEALKAEGVRNIDVGCMQVNLHHHPEAFDDLSAAFDPDTNADYAATFLKALFEETRSWSRAVAFYHSRTPDLAQAYRARVMAAWNGERNHAMEMLRQLNLERREAQAERREALQLRTTSVAPSAFMNQLRKQPSVYITTKPGAIRIRTY